MSMSATGCSHDLEAEAARVEVYAAAQHRYDDDRRAHRDDRGELLITLALWALGVIHLGGG
jgi:hypothetical protein